jgi:hypothetical protein
MTQQDPSNVFQAAGKTLAWQPIVRNQVLLEPVVEDVRPEMQQVAHFAMLCVAMHARMDETDDIIQALQYCERTHGYGRISTVLPSVIASIENAVELIPATIAQLGMQRQLANPGLFVGSLVEELARIPGNTRKFPLSQYRERLHSPRVEFEDCLLGAGVAKKLGLLDETQPHLTRPYSRLMTEFRRKLGKEGVLIVDETARNVLDRVQDASQRVSSFIRDVEQSAKRNDVLLPALWRVYVSTMKS